MAKMRSGILGKITGKVGGLIGSQWKGTPYIRAYAKPANPRTPAQTKQREKLKFVVSFARLIKTQIIEVYWDRLVKTMSGFNKFVSVNVKNAASPPSVADIIISIGSLESLSSLETGKYKSLDGNLSVSWDSSTMGNGDATDEMTIVVYDDENNIVWVDTTATRGDEEVTISLGTGRSIDELYIFAFCTQGIGKDMLVCPSTYNTVEEAPM